MVGIADLFVKAAVKEHLEGRNVANDFCDTLDEKVATVLDNVARRTEENDRKTVQTHDL